MKEMTTAEFAKANLAALEEPVSIRRYTKTVGTYYPGAAPDQTTARRQPELVPPDELVAAANKIDQLEAEVKQLKKKLAARPGPLTPTATTLAILRRDDPFAGLAKQDRDFFERKLGEEEVTRDEIVEKVAEIVGLDDDGEIDEELVLFDGMEDAFIGVAERFEEGGHRYFAVYSYRAMVELLTSEPDETVEDAIDYLEFNTVGLYAGPGTPAILRDFEEHV